MAMRAQNDGRRIYVRAGNLIILYGGVYFGPGAKAETKMDKEKEVSVEVLAPAGGKKRIAVTQKVGKEKVTETWNEKHLKFAKRTAEEENAEA